MDNHTSQYIVYNAGQSTMRQAEHQMAEEKPNFLKTIKCEVIESEHQDQQLQHQRQQQYNEKNIPTKIPAQIMPNNIKQESGLISRELSPMMTEEYLGKFVSQIFWLGYVCVIVLFIVLYR